MIIVRQEWDGGCGLACVAMICNTTFSDVANSIKIIRNKTGSSTSIKDFESLLPRYNVKCNRIKFKNWDDLNGVYIVGVNEYKNYQGNRGGWHWVVVIKNEKIFFILDPDENECVNWGEVWINQKDGYKARENCDIIKCNIRFPEAITINANEVT